MNGLFKVFITVSLFAAGLPWASAGPVQNVRRQDGSVAAPAPTDSASSVPESSATESVPAPIITPTLPPPVASSTTAASTPAFTPFTGTAVFAPPAVSLVGAFMSENPEFRTRSFTVPTETATPTCNVLTCPLTYSNGVPIYGGSTSLPIFPSPFSENVPAPTDVTPTPSGAVPSDVATPSGAASPSTGTDPSASAGVPASSGVENIVVPTTTPTPPQEPNPTDV